METSKEDQTLNDLDKEIDQINKTSRGIIDEDEPKTEDPKEEPSKEEESKADDTPEVEEEVEETDSKTPERPQRYIPMPKYQEEKKAWKQNKEELTTAKERISQLEKELESAAKPKEDTKKSDDKIKSFAEKHKMDEEAARDLIDIARDGSVNKDVLKQIDDFTKKVKEQEELASFSNEWSTVSSQIKEKYPDATKEQITKAKKTMDELAHTQKYHQTTLDYILFKENSVFDEMLGAEDSSAGIESSRIGGKPNSSIVSFKPLKDGSYNFDKLHRMDEGENKTKVVNGLDDTAFMAYVNDLEKQDGIEVGRNGRKIILK